MTADLRYELQKLPERMQKLPLDKRGYPVPRFVQYVNGEPDFRVMSRLHWTECVTKTLCWVCGERLGRMMVFPIGPMCAINRTTSEPPCHRDCAVWSACNCPFLSRPHMVRREDDMTLAARENVAGEMIDRNPGAVCIWTTRTYKLFRDRQGRPLIQVGPAERVEWYAQGRKATRAEVEESIRTGLPLLEQMAAEEGVEAVSALHQAVEAMRRLLPGE